MDKPISKSTIYVTGAALNKDMVYLIGEDRGLKKSDVEHARIIAFYLGNFYHSGDRNWRGVGIGIARLPSTKVVAVGEDGDVFTYAGGKAVDELIQPRPVCFRNLNVIDGIPYACGMKRQVARRDNDNSWIVMNAPPPQDDQTAGFEAIAGYSAKEIYAVGWNGEIWEHDGSQWLHRGSPTNLILTGLTCAGNGEVYICGQRATLLHGRHDLWEIIDLDPFIQDLWDAHWYGDKLYLASMTGLFTWTAADGLVPVDFGPDKPTTCYRLTSAEKVLYSIGTDDVFSFDGTTWTRVD